MNAATNRSPSPPQKPVLASLIDANAASVGCLEIVETLFDLVASDTRGGCVPMVNSSKEPDVGLQMLATSLTERLEILHRRLESLRDRLR